MKNSPLIQSRKMRELFQCQGINKYDYNSKLLIETRKKQRGHSQMQNEVVTMLNQFNFIKQAKQEEIKNYNDFERTQQVKFMNQEPSSTLNHHNVTKSSFRSRVDKFYKKFPPKTITTSPLMINAKILNVQQKQRSISVRRRFQTTQEKTFRGNNNEYIKLVSQTGCISNMKQTKRMHTFGSWSRKSSDNIREIMIK